MSVYRVTFIANQIETIKLSELQTAPDGEEDFFYLNNGALVFALVKADSEEDARKIALRMIERIIKGK